jgi:hypothetical protein
MVPVMPPCHHEHQTIQTAASPLDQRVHLRVATAGGPRGGCNRLHSDLPTGAGLDNSVLTGGFWALHLQMTPLAVGAVCNPSCPALPESEHSASGAASKMYRYETVSRRSRGRARAAESVPPMMMYGTH